MLTKVHVGNLSWNVTNDDLRNAFSSYGCILDLIVIRNPENGLSRGFGYVTFRSDQEAQEAIANLDQLELDGRPIKVSWARPRCSSSKRGGKRYDYWGSGGSGGRGYGGYSRDYSVRQGSFGQPAFGAVPQGGYSRQGFHQYGYGSENHGGQGDYYQQGGYRDGGYF